MCVYSIIFYSADGEYTSRKGINGTTLVTFYEQMLYDRNIVGKQQCHPWYDTTSCVKIESGMPSDKMGQEEVVLSIYN